MRHQAVTFALAVLRMKVVLACRIFRLAPDAASWCTAAKTASGLIGKPAISSTALRKLNECRNNTSLRIT